MRRLVFAVVFSMLAASAMASEGAHPLRAPEGGWPQAGLFGTYDRGTLQRGFAVYKQVCAACHSMNLVNYRHLKALGYSEAEVKAIAAEVEVEDGPDDEGKMFERKGRPSDKFKAPFPNEKAARAANGGAMPVDLSLIVKARHHGNDYVYSLLTGYEDAPAGTKLMDGMNYNPVFSGGQIAMPNPLSADDLVAYSDGTKATREQMAKDVVQFLAWAADPHMEERKRIGARVMLFLLVMAGVFYAAKVQIWRNVH
jgi:ubiquinol-cytochrome c reductase cytochrome c1 subunit